MNNKTFNASFPQCECEVIKESLDSLKQIVKQGIIPPSYIGIFNSQYEVISSNLIKIEEKFKCKEKVVNTLNSQYRAFQDKRMNFISTRIVCIVILALVQYVLAVKWSDLLGINNAFVSVLNWVFIVAIFIVQMILIIEIILIHYKYNMLIGRLELLKLKVEIKDVFSFEEVERELQLITKLWDNKNILDVFIKH